MKKNISLCTLSLFAFSYMFLGARSGNQYIDTLADGTTIIYDFEGPGRSYNELARYNPPVASGTATRLLENFSHANHNVNQSISTPSVVDPETSAELADEAEDITCPICFASAQKLHDKNVSLMKTTCCKNEICASCVQTIIARRNNCPFCRAAPLEYREENTNTISEEQPENNASISSPQPSSVENTQIITESSSHPELVESHRFHEEYNHSHSESTPYHWLHRHWEL
jgi:hypothetical protein